MMAEKTATIRLLHTADLHLGAPLKNFGELARERGRDFVRTFERIINLAIRREVDVCLVAGDLFDSHGVDAETVGRVQEGFSRLAGRGVATVLIPGTHDHLVSRDSIYNRYQFPGVHILDEPLVTEPLRLTVRGNEVFFYGFAHRTDGSADALQSLRRRQSGGVHVGLLHGSLKGSTEWEMRRKDTPFSVDDLASLELDYVALGHYHGFATMEKEGRVIACYPGSPEGKKFGENGPRYVALVEAAAGQAVVEKVEIQSRLVDEFSLDASLFSEEEALLGELTRLSRTDLIARIRLTGTVEQPLNIANLTGRLQGRFAWLDLIDETDIYDSSLVKRLEREDSIRGLFIRKVHGRFESCENGEEQEALRDALKLVISRFSRSGGV